MKVSELGRYALRASMAVAMLTGCGSQPLIGAPGAMRQTSAIAPHAGRGGSWMLPGAVVHDLLYVSVNGNVKIFSSRARLVGELKGIGADGLCSDSAGDVFVMDPGGYKIIEYAHGGTTPIDTLNTQISLRGCSVDRTTGNLAATGAVITARNPSVVVYPWSGGTFGPSTTYTDSRAADFAWCSYDGRGNLFANGSTQSSYKGLTVLDELRHGENSLVNVSLPRSFGGNGAVQWDGTYLAIADQSLSAYYSIYQLHIAKFRGTVVNAIKLKGSLIESQFWIQGDKIITSETGHDVGIWRYPAGGKPIKAIYVPGPKVGVTISLAPH